MPQHKCIFCGCTKQKPCFDDKKGDACYWIIQDKESKLALCSECFDKCKQLLLAFPLLIQRQFKYLLKEACK